MGGERLTINALQNIEYGRRDKEGRRRREITVDELLIFAFVLNVAPLHLLVPPEGTVYPLLPRETELSSRVREWIRGREPLPHTDPRVFFAEVPKEDWQPPGHAGQTALSPERLDGPAPAGARPRSPA